MKITDSNHVVRTCKEDVKFPTCNTRLFWRENPSFRSRHFWTCLVVYSTCHSPRALCHVKITDLKHVVCTCKKDVKFPTCNTRVFSHVTVRVFWLDIFARVIHMYTTCLVPRENIDVEITYKWRRGNVHLGNTMNQHVYSRCFARVYFHVISGTWISRWIHVLTPRGKRHASDTEVPRGKHVSFLWGKPFTIRPS